MKRRIKRYNVFVHLIVSECLAVKMEMLTENKTCMCIIEIVNEEYDEDEDTLPMILK